jgi:hypothetical protein
MEEPTPPKQPLCVMREYGRLEVVIANIPYVVMTNLGAAIFAVGWDGPVWNWVLASAYLLYGVFGVFLIVLFVCPFCAHHGTNSCPCGYGKIAAKGRKKQEIECFDKKFKTYIPMIVPLWFLPLIVGGYIAVQQFSWWYGTLLVVFAIDAFVILPLVSTQHGCKECPQRDTCPWMTQKPLASMVSSRS